MDKAIAMRQSITISGRNWNEIIALPCVSAIHKDNDDNIAVSVRPNSIKDYDGEEGGWYKAAHIGDTLVEYADGKWEIIHNGD